VLAARASAAESSAAISPMLGRMRQAKRGQRCRRLSGRCDGQLCAPRLDSFFPGKKVLPARHVGHRLGHARSRSDSSSGGEAEWISAEGRSVDQLKNAARVHAIVRYAGADGGVAFSPFGARLGKHGSKDCHTADRSILHARGTLASIG
jgi:hypothetical protein